MTEKLHKEPYILWQKSTDDQPIPERPIVVEVYSDIICLKQEGQSLNLNYQSIDEFCKLLKMLKSLALTPSHKLKER